MKDYKEIPPEDLARFRKARDGSQRYANEVRVADIRLGWRIRASIDLARELDLKNGGLEQ